MFGQVPRLLVDMVFGQVLRDDRAVDYGTYASKLIVCPHEAVSIAQQHTRKEQKNLISADTYNKKVQGISLNVGDTVPLSSVCFVGE